MIAIRREQKGGFCSQEVAPSMFPGEKITANKYMRKKYCSVY